VRRRQRLGSDHRSPECGTDAHPRRFRLAWRRDADARPNRRAADADADADHGAGRWPGSEDPALAHWERARRRLLDREARRNRAGARNLAAWQELDPDAPPPF
jgi:hypothetical protein